MNYHKINFTDIYHIPALIKDFLTEEKYSPSRFSLSNAIEKAKEKQNTFSSEQRKILHKVLREQMQN